MHFRVIFLFLGAWFFTVNAIELSRSKSKYSGISSSSSSSSSEFGHGRGGHSGRGPRRGGSGPRPPPRGGPRPPPSSPNPTCPAGWTLFNRKMGPWCVQLFPGAVGQAEAENSCRSQGATLSSIENAEERNIIAHIGLNHMSPTGWKFGTIRTGLRRDAIGSPWYTTDQFTTGMGGIVWSPLEPNNGYWKGRPNNCGLLWLWVPGGRQEGQRIFGTFFAMECLTSPPDRWRGFICGKKAT